ENNSFSSGQVLTCAYDKKKARVVIREMAEAVSLDLVEKRLVTDQLVLTLGYDVESLKVPAFRNKYDGPVSTDFYGRQVPKHAHGTANLGQYTSSTQIISAAVTDLFDRIVHPDLLIRRLNLTTNHVVNEDLIEKEGPQQLDLFVDYEEVNRQRKEEEAERKKERRLQEAQISIKKRFGRNAILKGLNFDEGATAKERNQQIGGHKA
ncbi:MAG: DNA methylase, partial [Phocaeicola sp.]|nr:DNA methylase [Phocaeicola sp.]